MQVPVKYLNPPSLFLMLVCSTPPNSVNSNTPWNKHSMTASNNKYVQLFCYQLFLPTESQKIFTVYQVLPLQSPYHTYTQLHPTSSSFHCEYKVALVKLYEKKKHLNSLEIYMNYSSNTVTESQTHISEILCGNLFHVLRNRVSDISVNDMQ